MLRTFTNLIEATLRTNYFQNKPHLSFKLDPAVIEGLPFPRPMFEIWVYSPRVEGVHLRFGKVARGGLRWSDRREDFRTEILGLVKAQTVKNAVIVPTGAKGGFFAKQLPDPAVDRGAWLAEGMESYKTFIRGLLDLTDNLVADAGRRNSRAAGATSCGTTTTIPTLWWRRTRERRRSPTSPTGWPRSTASGSAMPSPPAARWATTTRPWASPPAAPGNRSNATSASWTWTRQTEHFTVVGVGDMSGDVFGNGMLLSQHIRLLAAFDHRHIFLDPTPDAAASFAERQRLFELPRSSWDDYDKSLISEGGGVYARQAKSIPVSRAGPGRARPARGDHRAEPAGTRCGPSCWPRPTCSTTAASAPTSRPAPRPTPRSATRPMTPSASTARTCG